MHDLTVARPLGARSLLTAHCARRTCAGGEGVEGIYGTITKTGTSSIMKCLADKCGMGSDSILVDIGAGLAR